MLNIDGDKIAVSRGDTGVFTVTFTGQDAPEDNCTVLTSLKKTKDSEEIIWEKRLAVSNHMITFTLTSDDTNLNYGQYWWDLRIIFRDGTIYTPMMPAPFRVLEVIGDAS